MFRNYMIVAVRHLLRQKLYAFINVFGLAVGLACCILIFLYVRHEWQYDAFHENADRIYRVIVRETRPDGSVGYSTLHPVSLAASLKEEFPGIERASGFIRSRTQVSREKKFFRESFGMVEPDFLEMFSFPLLAGDPSTALQRLDGAVISETVARKLFGNLDGGYAAALGKPLFLGGKPFAVTGVMRDVPETSSLKFSLLIPIEYHGNYGINTDEIDGKSSVYVQVTEGQDADALAAAFPPFAEKYLGRRIRGFKSYGRVRNTEDGFLLRLQPLRDVYLNNEVRRNSYEAGGNVVYSYVLSGLALLVLAIAGINYMTLAVGRSVKRAREVGMRKAMGAHRAQLMGQFWGEALLLSLIALAMAVALAEMFLPVFSGLARKNLSIPYLDGWGTALVLSGMVFIVGLAAGSYPALVLPGLQTVDVLKGQLRIGGRNAGSRALVVGQYAMSISLMIGAAMMFRQLNYVRDKDLGYREEQVVIVRGMVSNADAVCARYKAEIAKSPGVVSATISDRAFTTGYNVVPMEKVNGDRLNVRVIQIDRDYLETLDIRLVAGRNIPPASSSDSTSYALANEKLAGMLDWGETVGKTLRNPAWRNLGEPTIIGVVGDFHFDSMRKEIQPLLLHDDPGHSAPSF